ncbi:nucleotidyltransferase domain-containing protein [Granulicoccus phenolivorans]|uniref:nucleotidyltransferase domain-containing protein n=1 Tax=Granulicoccus phenolivorans TaxID=266854 RepID=UPI00041A837F|nr:nucleotidyltransferase domain-containing protein [Granulicoccus phenolivorans]
MQELTDSFEPAVVAEVMRRLAGVRAEYGVAIPWAIESGSRAWGFPSPDSDYDCRFFYVRSVPDHVTPWQPRDVIETPVDAVFDVNGWDLAKAVRLAAGGNATVAEWLSSPFVYDGDPEFREALLSLAGEILDPARVRRHYAHVGARQWERSGAHTGEVKSLKRVFYALRPAAVLHWMDLYDRPTPPMNLLELLDQAPPPPDVRATVDELLATKAITREMGAGVVPANVRTWIERQLDTELHRSAPNRLARPTARAIEGYRDLVSRFAPQPGQEIGTA